MELLQSCTKPSKCKLPSSAHVWITYWNAENFTYIFNGYFWRLEGSLLTGFTRCYSHWIAEPIMFILFSSYCTFWSFIILCANGMDVIQNSTGWMAWRPIFPQVPLYLRYLKVESDDVINYWPGRLLTHLYNLKVILSEFYMRLA